MMTKSRVLMVPVQLPSCERAAVLAADAQRWVRGHVAARLLLLQTHAQRQEQVMETLRKRKKENNFFFKRMTLPLIQSTWDVFGTFNIFYIAIC